MEEEEIDVGTYDDANLEPAVVEFQCEVCKFVGKSDRSLSAHRRHNHPELVKQKQTPSRGRGRPRKESNDDDSQAVVPQRVTTKELLGGRKRPKTFVEPISDDSALRTNQEASRLHELGVVDADTPIGDFLRRGDRYARMEDDMDPSDMVVGEEVVIGDGDHDAMSPMPQRKYGPSRRRFGDKLAPRLAVGDPGGKYKCYVETCMWRGGYRSLRMDHMRAVHPEWKMPSRFLLERISKDNVYIDPKDHRPPFGCTVEGCEWRGNYRASRSAHMKKAHPEEHAAKKKRMPGYGSNGNYGCHYPACTWRGWSRSTRSAHLKRAHPEWRPEDSRIIILLTCFHCKSIFNSYPLLVVHLANHGGIGLHVDETFDSREEFSKWMHRIEAFYSMSFERHDPLNAEFQDTEPEPNMYILHCSVVGHRGHQLANEARNYMHSTHSYLKRRPHYMMTRPKCDCSAHLEVREDPHYGTINVKGSLEHTGHRFGTPLLRMLPLERQLFCDILNWKGDEATPEVLGLDMLDRIVANEGFTMDNYAPTGELLLMEPLHADQLVSIRQLISQSDQDCFFAVKFDEEDPRKMHFGYQNLEMQKYWGRYAPNGVAVIDTVLLDFHNLELFQYTVIVVDENSTPKCAMLYLSSEQEGSPEIILERLVQLDPREPKTFLVDPSEVWVPLMEKYYGGDDPEKPRPLPEVLISEWSLMDYWTCKVQQYTENEIDAFFIISALRRGLRSDDPVQLHSFFVELFEAFYEAGYDSLAHFFDMQLTDLDYVKRWSPLKRSGFTSHSHPLLGTASRTLRAAYLGLESIGRVDQWFAHATKRIEDYNLVDLTATFTVKQVEVPRKFYYGMMTPGGHEIVTNHHHQNGLDAQNSTIIYEDGEEGEEVVVGEEVIGHVNAEGEEILYENVVIQEGEFPLSQIETERQKPESAEEAQKDEEKTEGKEQTVEEKVVADKREIEEEEETKRDDVEQEQRPTSPQQSPPRRIPPHRLPVPPDTRPHPPPLPRPNPPRRTRGASQRAQLDTEPSTSSAPTPTVRPKRETTKSVVRNRRRKRDRFADLRDCPPEVMRAIAAHAIAYDGRKKEQHPFQFVPIPAKMAQGTVPEIPTPDLRLHSVPSMRRLMGHQQAQHSQQRLRELQERRAQDRQTRWARDEMADEDEMDQRPSTSSNPNLHPGHPIHHPRQNLRPPPPRHQRGLIPPHRLPPGNQQTRARMFHERPQYPMSAAQRQRHQIYREEEEEDVDVDVEEIEEVVEVVEEEIDVGTQQFYEEIYQEGYEQEEGTEVVVEHEDVIEEVIEEEVDVDGDIDDQQPCTSASLYR